MRPCGEGAASGNEGDTEDRALGGRVALFQPRRGYRFSLDAILLARFAAEVPAPAAVDLGCGCGVVALCLLALGGASQVVGVDLQAEMVARARRAAEVNGWEARARFVRGDLRDAAGGLEGEHFPLVVSNPPYRPVQGGRMSPEASVALARHEVACTIESVVGAASRLLSRRGQFCVVYPASRLTALLAAAGAAGLEPKRLRLVHPREGEAASLCLVRCQKEGREGLEVSPPLYLHAPGRRYSEEAERLLGLP